VEGFLAGAVGTLAILAPLYWLMTQAGDIAPPFNEWVSLLEWKDAAPLAGAPLLTALLAAAGARTASARTYEQMARRR
jgi:hypothetical protein